MGRDKALLDIGGRPLAAVAAAALRQAGAEPVVAVGGDGAALAALGLVPLADDHPGAGPLGGVVTALTHTRAEVVVILACDLPSAHPDAVRLVVAALAAAPAAGCAVPVHDGRPEPLHAAWRRSALPAVRAAFDGGARAVHRVLEAVGAVEVTGVDPTALADVDTPDQLGDRMPSDDATGAGSVGVVGRRSHHRPD